MLQIGRAEKVDEKNRIIKLSKKMHFFNFVLTSAKYAKATTYMHLKGLNMRFQKMLLFNMIWLNVLKIVFQMEEFC